MMKTVKTLAAALILISATVASAAPCNATRTNSGRHARTVAPTSVKTAQVATTAVVKAAR